MTGSRARLIVTVNGPWRLYQHQPPPGWEMLGVVQRGDEIGALVQSQGFGWIVCYSWEEAAAVIEQYLNQGA